MMRPVPAAPVSVPDPTPDLLQRATAVRRAAMGLGRLSDPMRRQAVEAMAAALETAADQILAANQADLEAAAADGLAPALVARLKLDAGKLAGGIEGVRQVAQLPDPLGVRQLHRELDQGLMLERVSVPLGVLGVIFEARPDAVMQIASLAIRSGNGAMLKGGREASHSCAAILEALRIAIDAKTQYPAACNAIETLLVHREAAPAFLAAALPAMAAAGVALRGDAAAQALGVSEAASDDDWRSEYSDLVLAVRVVDSLEQALDHISRYGSRHTDAICTTNASTAETFLRSVDSAGVYVNCSTRFADGFRYGFGAEVGISTQTLPPRGPVGLEGLVTYRYLMRGDGHIAADYASGVRSFTHRDLPL